MISIPYAVLQRATLIVLGLYFGTFLGTSLCVLHTSHTQSGMDGSTTHASSSAPAHASSSMATHVSSLTEVHASSWGAAFDRSHDGEHSGAPGPDHMGVCTAVSCASALAAHPFQDLDSMNRVSHAERAYFTGTMSPDAEMVLPPPRLG
jgi:hypothetical protein